MVRYLSCLSILIGFLLLCGVTSEAKEGFLIADGGIINDVPFPGAEPYNSMQLKVFLENGKGLTKLEGWILHPYGAGEFVTTFASSDLVTETSFEVMNGSEFGMQESSIHFFMKLTPAFTDEKTELFTAKPVTGPGYDLNRPGGLAGSYPYPVTWMGYIAYFNEDVELSLVSNPVLTRVSIGSGSQVTTQGFPKPIQSLSIGSVNGVLLYPPMPMEKTAENQYRLPALIRGISADPLLPLEYIVILEDGSRMVVRDANTEPEKTVSPQAGAEGWDLYR